MHPIFCYIKALILREKFLDFHLRIVITLAKLPHAARSIWIAASFLFCQSLSQCFWYPYIIHSVLFFSTLTCNNALLSSYPGYLIYSLNVSYIIYQDVDFTPMIVFHLNWFIMWADRKFRECCWDINQTGSVGETVLHLCLLNATAIHADLAKRLIQAFPKMINDIYLADEYFGKKIICTKDCFIWKNFDTVCCSCYKNMYNKNPAVNCPCGYRSHNSSPITPFDFLND